MARSLPPLGELEARIVQLVLDHQPCSERSLWDLVRQERDVTRTTVLKTIQRLETKGVLRRLPRTSPILWESTAEKRHVLRELVKRFVDGVLGGSAEVLAVYLTGHDDMTASDVAALKRIARKVAHRADNPQKGDKP